MRDLKIQVPNTRAPRLPRDHFAMRPQVSMVSRCVQAVAIGAAIIGILIAIHLRT